MIRKFTKLFSSRMEFVLAAVETETLAAARCPEDVQVRLVSADERPLLKPTAPRARWKLFQRYAAQGYDCYGAWQRGQLVGYLWIKQGGAHHSPLVGRIPMAKDEAFVGYAYVRPSSRGAGVVNALMRHAGITLAAAGVPVLYSGISVENRATLKSLARLGGIPLRRSRMERVGFWTRVQSGAVRPEDPLVTLFNERRRRSGLAREWPPIADPTLRWFHRMDASKKKTEWSPRDPVWMRFWLMVRQRGLQAGFREAWQRGSRAMFEQGTVIEFTQPLDLIVHTPRRVWAHPAIVEIGRHDLPRLEPILSRSLARTFACFLRQGMLCLAAEVDGRIVAYNWFSLKPYRGKSTGITYPLGPGEAFLVYSFTVRAWRGKGIDTILKVAAASKLRDLGFSIVRTVIDDTNRPSLRTLYRMGGSPCRRYRYVRFLGLSWASVEPVSPVAAESERKAVHAAS